MKRLLAIAMTIALFIAACPKDESITGDDAQGAMGLFAKGYNALLDEIKERLIKGYFDAIPEAGPEKMSRHLLFPRQNFASRSLTEAREAFASAKPAAPRSMAHLAGLADELLKAGEAVTAVYDEAQKYYAAENYRDDGGAKGRELHARMLAEARRFQEALDKFDKATDSIEDSQIEVEIKKFEAARNHSYWFRKMMLEGKKLVGTVSASAEPADWDEAFARFDATSGGFAQFINERGGRTGLSESFQSFVKMTDQYAVVAARLRREYKQERPDEDKIDAEIDNLIGAYNNIVSVGNALYQLEEYGQLK